MLLKVQQLLEINMSICLSKILNLIYNYYVMKHNLICYKAYLNML